MTELNSSPELLSIKRGLHFGYHENRATNFLDKDHFAFFDRYFYNHIINYYCSFLKRYYFTPERYHEFHKEGIYLEALSVSGDLFYPLLIVKTKHWLFNIMTFGDQNNIELYQHIYKNNLGKSFFIKDGILFAFSGYNNYVDGYYKSIILLKAFEDKRIKTTKVNYYEINGVKLVV